MGRLVSMVVVMGFSIVLDDGVSMLSLVFVNFCVIVDNFEYVVNFVD